MQENAEGTAQIEMPRYKSHKVVWALAISSVAAGKIYFDDARYGPREVKDDWLSRFKPKEGDNGFFIVYEDGYESWSPTDVFLKGYSLLEGGVVLGHVESPNAVMALHLDKKLWTGKPVNEIRQALVEEFEAAMPEFLKLMDATS